MKYVVTGILIVIAYVVVHVDVVVADRAKRSIPTLSGSYKIPESANPNQSINAIWWLSSGAYAYIDNGVARSVQGRLASHDPWRLIFLASNPIDTDNGYYPQNIFRLVTRAETLNYRQEVYVRISRINLSKSPNRNESNGIHLFNRYQDENSIYYTGIRVDGFAFIKKKYRGEYSTLASSRLIDSPLYDRTDYPNALPLNQWIGVASEIRTLPDGSILIDMFVDRNRSGTWEHVATATDRPTPSNPVISESGRMGIRTDFMDVEFTDYRVIPL